jgi:hypothetical protein
MKGRLLLALGAAVAATALTEAASAQEILLTGPLAGAPAVRQLRLYREGRFEIAPTVAFTLLDEYQRHILVGARLNYNFTDWLAVGAWGGMATGPLLIPTALSEHIQDVNKSRTDPESLDKRLTSVNLGDDFLDQIGSIDWVVAPQVTAVPFRGKLALFQGIHVDTDLYVFGGPAIVGVSEREECARGTCPDRFDLESRVTVAPTFGLGLTFYTGRFTSLSAEWRALPFSWNTSGFDVAGGDKDNAFPDNAISEADRQFEFNQMISISLSFYLPTMYRVSE